MKIYFYDGWLESKYHFFFEEPDSPTYQKSVVDDCDRRRSFVHYLDAGGGYRFASDFLHDLSVEEPDAVVFTNAITALDNDYAWNDEKNCSEIFLWRDKEQAFVPIQSLTDKEIRKPHNIMKMYMAGTFDEE